MTASHGCPDFKPFPRKARPGIPRIMHAQSLTKLLSPRSASIPCRIPGEGPLGQCENLHGWAVHWAFHQLDCHVCNALQCLVGVALGKLTWFPGKTMKKNMKNRHSEMVYLQKQASFQISKPKGVTEFKKPRKIAAEIPLANTARSSGSIASRW